jgi:hypothetical protein
MITQSFQAKTVQLSKLKNSNRAILNYLNSYAQPNNDGFNSVPLEIAFIAVTAGKVIKSIQYPKSNHATYRDLSQVDCEEIIGLVTEKLVSCNAFEFIESQAVPFEKLKAPEIFWQGSEEKFSIAIGENGDYVTTGENTVFNETRSIRGLNLNRIEKGRDVPRDIDFNIFATRENEEISHGRKRYIARRYRHFQRCIEAVSNVEKDAGKRKWKSVKANHSAYLDLALALETGEYSGWNELCDEKGNPPKWILNKSTRSMKKTAFLEYIAKGEKLLARYAGK